MMASSVAGQYPMSRKQTTVLTMPRERARDWATRHVRVVPKPVGAERRRRYFDDVTVVVWVFALIGIIVLCGAVMVLALISATVAVSLRIASPAFVGGALTDAEQNGAELVDDDWIYGPKLTR